MNDFECLSYHTEYSCLGDIEEELNSSSCFSDVFASLDDWSCDETVSVNYEIILFRGTILSKEYNESNACIFNKQQIKNHLKQAQEIFPFEFRIEEDDNWEHDSYSAKFPVYKVFLFVEDACPSFHKYILTWTRYLYEYPYNVLLLDAYRLKKDTRFTFTSIADIFNLVLGCYCEDLSSVHQIPRDKAICTPIKKKDIYNKLIKVDMLNKLYKVLICERKAISEYIDDTSICDLEYWTTEKYFNRHRKPIYLEVYKSQKKALSKLKN